MAAYPFLLYLLFFSCLILFLHLIRRQRKKITVSSLFVWERMVQTSRKVFLSPRLRSVLLLMLQIGVLVFLVLGAAGVSVSRPRRMYKENVFLIFDVSLSMGASTKEGSRLDSAKKTAEKMIRNLAPGKGMVIATLGRNPGMVMSFTGDKRKLLQALDGIKLTDEAGEREAGLRSLLSSAGTEDYHTVFITDTPLSADFLSSMGEELEIRYVGEPQDNLAITAFASRPPLHGRHDRDFYLEITSYASRDIRAPVSVEFDDGTVKSFDGFFPAGEKVRMIFPFDGFLSSRAEARIDYPDALLSDNQAYEVIRTQGTLRLLLVTPGNPALERLFGLLPDTTVTVTGTGLRGTGGADVVVYDRLSPGILEPGRYIFIDVLPPGFSFFPAGGFRREPVVIGEPNHPLTRYDVFDGVALWGGEAFSGEDTPLLLAGNKPVVSVYEGAGIKWIRLSPDLSSSDLIFRPAFPVLFGEGIGWLMEGSGEAEGLTAGEPLPGALPLSEVSLLGPDGEIQRLNADPHGLVYADTSRAGFYRLYQGEKETLLAVRPAGGDESDLRKTLSPADRGVPELASAGRTASRRLDMLMLTLALVLLLGEYLLSGREPTE